MTSNNFPLFHVYKHWNEGKQLLLIEPRAILMDYGIEGNMREKIKTNGAKNSTDIYEYCYSYYVNLRIT